MELLSADYGDFPEGLDGESSGERQSACLTVLLSVDPTLLDESPPLDGIVTNLGQVFPSVKSFVPGKPRHDGRTVACLVGSILLDLQRDLCAWPAGHAFVCRNTTTDSVFELCVESIDEHVAQFSAQVAVQLVRMLLLQEAFDPRLIWVIDLVRHVCHHRRFHLTARRVALRLGCSLSSAEWAIEGLERYGYTYSSEEDHSRRLRKRLILVVDDSSWVRDVLTRMLGQQGYDVITAVDGEEGLILLDWADYKAIFVDLMMPGTDGPTFLQRARAQGVTDPIFVISGYAHRWAAGEIQAMGATAYLRKPFSIAEVETLVKKHLK